MSEIGLSIPIAHFVDFLHIAHTKAYNRRSRDEFEPCVGQ